MKKAMKTSAAALAVLMSPVAASAVTTNMENPLFLPGAGQVISRTTAGMMYKQADHSPGMQARGEQGQTEFPITRLHQEIGYGITDRLAIRGQLGYTDNATTGRNGLTTGTIGAVYRVFDGMDNRNGIIWDVYADAHLGGFSPMEATMGGTNPMAPSIDFHNFSNGRWGAWVGTQVGKTWGDFTIAAYGEALRTFGNDNTRINIGGDYRTAIDGAFGGAGAFLPGSFSVETAGTWEHALGVRSFYQIDNKWAVSGGFRWRHRPANEIVGVNLDAPVQLAGLVQGLTNEFMGSMEDGMDEYIFTAAIARDITDNVQVALYAEYTFDSVEAQSVNGTDVKAEMGVRLNVQF